MYKNILKVVFSFLLVLGIANSASAISVPNTNFICVGGGNKIALYDNSTKNFIDILSCSAEVPANSYALGNYNAVEYNDWFNGNQYSPFNFTYAEFTAFDITSNLTISITETGIQSYTPIPPVNNNLLPNGLFYGRTNGNSDASVLTASVAGATGATFGSLGPVVVVVLGIILAFVLIKVVISLFNETGTAKKE